MANILFKPLPSNSPGLFREDIFDRIPSDHPVRLVNQVVDGLDISHLISQYKGGGATSFHPRMLVKVLFYSYLSNIYSCRKIEKALQENIHFMWLSGNSTPDFRTINYFRGKRLKGHIQTLFADVVRMLQELGYVSLDIQYIDGTKIESAAGRYTFVWKGSVEKNKAKLEAKIASVLADIECQIKADGSTMNNPGTAKPIDSRELKEKLSELNNKLKDTGKTTQKQLRKLQEEHLPRLEKYEQQLETLGDRNSYSKTDTDATFMRLKDDHMQNGQLKPAYNAQISTEQQFITHCSIHQTAGDTTTLEGHLEGFGQQYGTPGKEVVADSGYGSEENYELLETRGITAFVKYNYFHREQKRSHRNNPFLQPNLFYNKEEDFYVCPMGQRMEKYRQGKKVSGNGYVSQISFYRAKRCEGCPLRGMCHDSGEDRIIMVNHRLNELRNKARELLTSQRGLMHRSKRPIEPEAAFAQLKSNNNFNRFTLKGLAGVGIEFALMAIGHNLRKMAAKAKNSENNGPDNPFNPAYVRIYPLWWNNNTRIGQAA
ncbi:Transposase [Parapedobacter koreensis]|uniref:Transposase n=1 Tax=Parapedobacter koreensis TaxID=332977 RepID=A0A1H7RFL7_9SPHI|nr:Transposase [Parapedobacter koreensis]